MSGPEPVESVRLREYLDARMGDSVDLLVEPMVGGGSCDVYALTRGEERWVLRQAPPHRSSATAHDVLREFRFLDAIKDQPVRIAHPVLACDDPDVFGGPFYVMARIDGVPVRSSIPEAWLTRPEEQRGALDELVDALAAIHAVDWEACGLGEFGHAGPYLERQIGRWLSQLDSYGGRPLPAAASVGAWLAGALPPDQAPALAHGDYKLDNVLFAESAPPELLAVVDWEMASIGDPLVDLAWAMIFHPGPEGTMPLGVATAPAFDRSQLPTAAELVARYGDRTGRDVSRIDWYDVFSRWKLAIVLEGSYAKFLRGESKKPVHEHFGKQADQLLASTLAMVGIGSMTRSGDFELDADEIVAAAIVILQERGLDAVSMRNVADRLGVSPMPLYTRVGNKAALIDTVADHLLFDLAPATDATEAWPEYAGRWCRELRDRLKRTPDSRLYLGAREPYVEASRPLVAALRNGGLATDAAVQACRLLMWATVGFVAMEQGSSAPASRAQSGAQSGARRSRLSGGDPGGVTPAEADELFDLQIGILTAGIARMHGDPAGEQTEDPAGN